MAKSVTLDFAYDEDDLAEALVRTLADIEVTYRIVQLHGPGGGWPVIKFVGKRKELEKLLRGPYQMGDADVAESLPA